MTGTLTKAIIGRKLGMTQIFDDEGALEAITAIEAGPCYVVQKKTKARDGYDAVQLGFGPSRRCNSPEKGHLKAAGRELRYLNEFRLDDIGSFEVGQALDASMFKRVRGWTLLACRRGRASRDDVATAIALEPSQLSYYQLTLEPNTPFHHHPPVLPDDEVMWSIHQQGQQQLAAAGYAQYEVSAYAKPGWQCRHNPNYWQFGDYLGIGAGAHGKITDPQRQRYVRRCKVRHPQEYLHASGVARLAGQSEADEKDAAFEFMLNALRLSEGFPSSLLSERAGLPLATLDTPLRKAVSLGLLEWQEETITPTPLGYNHLNTLLEMFLAESCDEMRGYMP